MGMRTPVSGIDLTLDGWMGTFQIKADGQLSTNIRYLQTFARFSTTAFDTAGMEAKLFDNLKPFRETFDIENLDLEQILQRDLDDSRIANRLIPYILNKNLSQQTVLFPPIIIAIVPYSNAEMAKYMPRKRETLQIGQSSQKEVWGESGREVLQMETEPGINSWCRLGVSTQASRLVIIDGQHRAMALLALFRNLNSWPEKAARYKKFYEFWSRDRIQRYDLSEVRLPAMILTFPDLYIGSPGSNMITVPEACRSIFLSLNSTAKPVTRSRNLLLNDYDYVCVCMRRFLSEWKTEASRGTAKTHAANTELDNVQDSVRLEHPLSLTGVTHIHNVLVQLLLRDNSQVAEDSVVTNHWKIGSLQPYVDVVGARNSFTDDELRKLKKSALSVAHGEILSDRFWESLGQHVLTVFTEFNPYKAHVSATVKMKHDTTQNQQMIDFFFSGQASLQVHKEFPSAFEEFLGGTANDNERVRAITSDFRRTIDDFLRIESVFKSLRFKEFGVRSITDEQARLASKFCYDEFFLTSAFQSALILTFFSAVRLANGLDISSCLAEYMNHINDFFKGENFERIVQICGYKKDEDRYIPIADGLKEFMVPGELKPAEWNKFRYLFLELWMPSESSLSSYVEEKRKILRKSLLEAFYSRKLNEKARQSEKSASSLAQDDINATKEECVKSYHRNLQVLLGNRKPAINEIRALLGN